MQGFFKQEMNNIKQILFCTDPQVSVGIIVDDSGVDAGDDGRKIVKAGTPMYGSLLDRATPFTVTDPSTHADAEIDIEATTVSSIVTSADTLSAKLNNVSGKYTFEFFSSEGTWWLLNSEGVMDEEVIDLSSWGIGCSDTPTNGDKIVIDLTAAIIAKVVGVLLHDVDVTAGDDNGTLLIFGFVNINRLDEATATAIQAAASDLDGKVFVCAG